MPMWMNDERIVVVVVIVIVFGGYKYFYILYLAKMDDAWGECESIFFHGNIKDHKHAFCL